MKERGIRGNKLLWQYFISYLAVMLTVMAILLVYAYESFHRFHSQILLGNYANSLELIRETNESELSTLVSMTGQFTSSLNISPFTFQDEPEKAIRLMNQLSSYKASSSFIGGLYLHFYGDDYVFSSTSSYQLDGFVNRAAVFEDISPEELLRALEGTKRMTVYPEQDVDGYIFNSTKQSKRVLPIFVPVSYSSGVHCGTVMYLIETSIYENWFSTMASGSVDLYIMQRDRPLVSRQVSGVPLESVLVAAQEENAELRWEREKYHLIQIQGKTWDFTYSMLISDRELGVAMGGTVKMLLVVAAVVAALGLLLITRFVQSKMQPIRLLHSMLLDREPTGNELIEIRDSVQRLIDDNAMMATRMESVEALRKADFARRFLTGGFEDADAYFSMAEEIHVNVDMRYFAVCILAQPPESLYELMPDKLNHLFDERVSGVARTLGLYGKVILIAFSNDQQMLFAFLHQKFAGIRASSGGITMAVSGAHSDYREGQHAYLEAENAFERRFLQGNAVPICFEAAMEKHGETVESSQQAVERLRIALRAGEAERVCVALDEITRLMRGTNTSLFGFRCMYNDILNVVSAEARDSAAEEEIYDLFKLSECLSLEDLDTMLRGVCARLIAGRVAPRVVDAPAPVREAMEIIRRRFSEPGISVSSIAQQVGMSDSRLSVEFKKAYQMTPLECLTSHRMRSARRLLSTTDMPVKDIAVECGYYDISGFNRRFKVQTGMTPQQFRQANQDTGE